MTPSFPTRRSSDLRRLCTRKIKSNFRSPPRCTLDLEMASLLLEDAADDAEPQACRRAILPRREERLEHPLQLLRCHTLPIVPNGRPDIITSRLVGAAAQIIASERFVRVSDKNDTVNGYRIRSALAQSDQDRKSTRLNSLSSCPY